MQAKIGNMTCVLRETQVLNSQNELDFTVQKKSMDQFKTSKWFKDRIINNMEMCIKTAEALPYEAQEQYNFQGVVNMAKVKSYMQCMKYAKIKTCMYQDVKNKLEQN